MLTNGSRGQGRSYKELRRMYEAYLQTYKKLNGGSLKGATPFFHFCHYRNYTVIYSDPYTFMLMGHQ